MTVTPFDPFDPSPCGWARLENSYWRIWLYRVIAFIRENVPPPTPAVHPLPWGDRGQGPEVVKGMAPTGSDHGGKAAALQGAGQHLLGKAATMGQ